MNNVVPSLGDFVEGTHYGLFTGEPPAGRVCYRVRYNGADRDVWVYDRGVRPPDPGGVWLDDLISECCRRLFGCARGSCRPVQGEGVLEFREWWDNPLRAKVREDVRVAVVKDGREIDRGVMHVECAALPGCDVRSVVYAATLHQITRRYGPGRLDAVPGRDHEFAFHCGALVGGPGAVDARYTIHRPGGAAVDIAIKVPKQAAGHWPSLVYAVGLACRQRFGPGTLRYCPELGEDHFTFG